MSHYDALCGLFDLQEIAEVWHGGQGTALYSFLSTERIHSAQHADECLHEIRDFTFADADEHDCSVYVAREALEHIAADFDGFEAYMNSDRC